MTEDEEDILFNYGLEITDQTIDDVHDLFELLDLLEHPRAEALEDAKFNSYIQIRILSYNKKRELALSSLSKLS
jgi:hypothetical protein